MRGGRARAALFAVVAAALLWWPQIAEACSVCMSFRDEENKFAFILMTAFMTLTPLALIGSLAWWLRSRIRQLDAEAERARERHEAA